MPYQGNIISSPPPPPPLEDDEDDEDDELEELDDRLEVLDEPELDDPELDEPDLILEDIDDDEETPSHDYSGSSGNGWFVIAIIISFIITFPYISVWAIPLSLMLPFVVHAIIVGRREKKEKMKYEKEMAEITDNEEEIMDKDDIDKIVDKYYGDVK